MLSFQNMENKISHLANVWRTNIKLVSSQKCTGHFNQFPKVIKVVKVQEYIDMKY